MSGTPVTRPGAPRRRERHGRGLRGVLMPPRMPANRSPAERFDATATAAMETLRQAFPAQLRWLELAVRDVPPSDPAPWENHGVQLGRLYPGTRSDPPRIVLYRRPVMSRASTRDELEILVRQVLSEQVGSLLAMAPEDVDPGAWAW
jgi:predicted Zn-dependent protease with MMP-like domain